MSFFERWELFVFVKFFFICKILVWILVFVEGLEIIVVVLFDIVILRVIFSLLEVVYFMFRFKLLERKLVFKIILKFKWKIN